MLPRFSGGQPVRHPRYGKGVILGPRDGGQTAYVFFKLLSLARYLPASDLILLGPDGNPIQAPITGIEGEPQAAQPPAIVPAGPPSEVPIEKRRVLECLRQGLPPPGRLMAWTVGFEQVRMQIEQSIAAVATQRNGAVFVLAAEYGQGKSHVGQLALEMARRSELLTMNVDLDGRSVTLRDGSRILALLLASAHLPDGEGTSRVVPGLGTILKEAAARLRGRIPSQCELFAPFLEIAEQWEGNEEAIELLERYLSGEGKRLDIQHELSSLLGPPNLVLPPLKTNWGRLSDRLSAQATQLARVVRLGMEAGAKGALVVIDEFDHEFGGYLRISERSQDALQVYCRLAEIGPVVFLLLTPAYDGLGLSNPRVLTLPKLDRGQLRQVMDNAVAAHKEVFPDLLDDGRGRLFQRLYRRYEDEYEALGWGPRFFVRAGIEACDRALEKRMSLGEIEL